MTTGIKTEHLKNYIIVPALERLSMYSPTAVNLLLGTAAVESEMGHWLVQDGGPALGIFQMEPDTHNSLWGNYIKYRPNIEDMVRQLIRVQKPAIPHPDAMVYDLLYAAMMCRLNYFSKPARLPPRSDGVEGLAHYWKDHHNTPAGKGTVAMFILRYKEYVHGY